MLPVGLAVEERTELGCRRSGVKGRVWNTSEVRKPQWRGNKRTCTRNVLKGQEVYDCSDPI